MGRQRGLSQLLAGGITGYMAGIKIKNDKEDAEAKREEREARKEEKNREKLMREAAASTLGAVGSRRGAAVSGEEALSAGMGSMEDRMANAADDQERASIQKSYEPTIAALQAQRGLPAMEGEVYTQDQARKDYVQAVQGIDPGKAAQAELQGYQLDKFRTDAEKDRVVKAARDATSKWLKGRIKKDENGAPTELSNEDLALGTKVMGMHLAEGGQFEKAFELRNEYVGYAAKKIQLETAERADAATKAAALARNGSYDAAIEVSKKFLPDGSTITKLTEGKDGRITVERQSTLDGAALKPVIYKNRDELATSLLSIADPKAATEYIDRTYRHDIETRRLGLEGSRLGIAKDAEARAKGKDEREQKRQDAADQAIADMDVAERAGDKAAYNNARLRAIRNGVKLDKPEAQKADVKVGTIGDITVTQPTSDGGAVVTNYGPDMKPRGTVTIPPAGQQGGGQVPAPGAQRPPATQADLEATAAKYGITVDEVKKRLNMK